MLLSRNLLLSWHYWLDTTDEHNCQFVTGIVLHVRNHMPQPRSQSFNAAQITRIVQKYNNRVYVVCAETSPVLIAPDNAVSLTREQFDQRTPELLLLESIIIVVYCSNWMCSETGTYICKLKSTFKGFVSVIEFIGGITEWTLKAAHDASMNRETDYKMMDASSGEICSLDVALESLCSLTERRYPHPEYADAWINGYWSSDVGIFELAQTVTRDDLPTCCPIP